MNENFQRGFIKVAISLGGAAKGVGLGALGLGAAGGTAYAVANPEQRAQMLAKAQEIGTDVGTGLDKARIQVARRLAPGMAAQADKMPSLLSTIHGDNALSAEHFNRWKDLLGDYTALQGRANIGDAIRNAGSSVAGAVHDVGSQAGHALKDVGTRAGNALHSGVSSLHDLANRVREGAGNAAYDVGNLVESTGRDIGEGLGGAMRKIKSQVSGGPELMSDRIEGWKNSVNAGSRGFQQHAAH